MMDHCTQTADGLATWIERRQHTPAELRQILRLALQDAEKRGAQLASLEAPADPPALMTGPDRGQEPPRPLNAHVGRRMPVGRLADRVSMDRDDVPVQRKRWG